MANLLQIHDVLSELILYRHQLNPRVPFFKMGFRTGFKLDLGEFCQNLSIFTTLIDSNFRKSNCSARDGAVVKSGVQLAPIR